MALTDSSTTTAASRRPVGTDTLRRELTEHWSIWIGRESCPAAATEQLLDWIEARSRRA